MPWSRWNETGSGWIKIVPTKAASLAASRVALRQVRAIMRDLQNADSVLRQDSSDTRAMIENGTVFSGVVPRKTAPSESYVFPVLPTL